MLNIDEESQRVGQLYRQMTGVDPRVTETPLAPIPPDANPEQYVRDNLNRLHQALRSVASPRLPSLTPRLSVYENESEWKCILEMPGVRRSEISVNVAQGMLRVAATRGVNTAPVDSIRPVYSETSPCRFERSIPMPAFVRADSAAARLENGVLTVRFSKDSAAVRKDLPVEVS